MASLWKHTGIAMLITAVSYTAFTVWRGQVPHPEDASPFFYAVAFIAGVQMWLLLPKERKWLYVPVLVLCLLALLDEAGYGSEVMDIAPIYSESMNTEIRDLHNAIAIGIGLLTAWLEEMRWNWDLFVSFLTPDAAVLGGAVAFGWLQRRGAKRRKAPAWKQRALWVTAGFLAAAALISAGYLFSLPPDPRNAILLGYSAVRLASALSVLTIGLTPLVVIWRSNQAKLLKRIEAFMRSRAASVGQAFLWVGALAMVAYQFYAPFLFLPDDRVRLERITPLALWLLASAVFLLLGMRAWRGGLARSVRTFIGGILTFFRREPAFFYGGAALFLILVAQLNDKHLFPIDEATGLWIEEVFETTGSFMFIAAAVYFHKDP
jgi:hypothetical protein